MKRTLLSFKNGIIACLLLGGIQPGHAQKTEWVTAFGGSTGRNGGVSVAVDAAGNTYTAGYFADEITVPTVSGNVVLRAGDVSGNSFVMKTDTSGRIQWIRQIGPSRNMPGSLSLDAGGNVYIAGYFQDSVHFDAADPASYLKTGRSNSMSNRDVFVARLDAEGRYSWLKRLGGAGTNEAVGVKAGTAGQLYVAGTFTTTAAAGVSYDGHSIRSAGQKDIFVCRMAAADGAVVWAKRAGGEGDETLKAFALDNQDNILMTGGYRAKADFNPDQAVTNELPDPPFGQNDVFALKLNSEGAYQWARSWGNTGGTAEIGNAITADADRNVYITGQYIGTNVDFDPDPSATFHLSSRSYDVFVSKLDENGLFRWAKGYGSTETLDEGTGIATDAAGNVYVTGVYLLTTDFNEGGTGGQLSAWANRDVFILRLSGTGSFGWVRSARGSDIDGAGAIAVGADNRVYVTGWTAKQSDFFIGPVGNASLPYSARAEWDFFLHKVNQVCSSDTAFSISSCGPYEFNGITYNASDVYQVQLENIHGCDSTISLALNILAESAAVISLEGCDSVTINDFTYYTSDTYTQTLKNAVNCDSILTCVVTIGNTPVAEVIRNGTTLTAGVADTWTWIDCDDGNPVPGASAQMFTPEYSGNYAVVAGSIGGCTDTSACYQVTIETDEETGVREHGTDGDRVRIYPNPVKGLLFVDSEMPVSLKLCSVDGKVLLQVSGDTRISTHDLPAGIYLLHVTDAAGNPLRVEKLYKH